MATITGSNFSDYLTGTDGDDVIDGLGGDDTISGGDGSDTIHGGDGSDSLRGEGGNDFLYGGAGNDHIDDGAGNDHVEGGEGNDGFTSSVGGSDFIDGGGGDDHFQVLRSSSADSVTLLGGAGADTFEISMSGTATMTVDAGEGDDDLNIGSFGHYAVTLGAGRDMLRLGGGSFYTPSGLVIADFETGPAGDRIDLSRTLLIGVTGWNSGLSPFATGHLRLIQSGSDALLQIDYDGGGNGYVTLVTFSNRNATAFTFDNLDGFSPDGTIPAGQNLDGTEFADQLIGTAGDDMIGGLGGADTIWGGAGADHISGGDGDDWLYGEWGNDTIDGGSGLDYIYTGDGDDVVHGGDGTDIIDSEGLGNATLHGDADDDQINIYRSSPALAQTVTAYGGAGKDTLNVEGYGSNCLFVLDGGTGDDIVRIRSLWGTADVTLGDGSDTLSFMNSNQQWTRDYGSVIVRDFQVGAGGDKLDIKFWLSGALDNWDQFTNPFGTGQLRLVQSGADVLLQVDHDGSGNAAVFRTLITFKNVDAANFVAANLDGFAPDGSAPPGVTLIGTSADEMLIGTSGSDHIEGGGGRDTLRGEGGDDTLIGGASPSTLLGGTGKDILYAGDGGDIMSGDSGDDVLHGGAGADILYVGTGGDLAYGAGGGDHFYLDGTSGTTVAFAFGEAGDDEFDISSSYFSSFHVNGGEGDDRFNIGAIRGNVDLTLGSGRDSIGFAAGRFDSGPQNLFVTDFAAGAGGDFLLLSTSLPALVTGWTGTGNPFEIGYLRLVKNGPDTIVAIDVTRGGNMFVPLITLQNLHPGTLTAANFGYDPGFVYGTEASDTLNGTNGNDRLAGSGGDDVLKGGLGDDTYLVLNDHDVVTELAGEGTDTIRTALGTQAAVYALAANVENLVGTSLGSQTVAGNALDNVLTMGSGNDVMDLSSGGNDTAYGNDGNDYVYFGAAFTADDVIVGGAGTDTVGLLGNYDLTLGANTLSGVETFSLLSGTAAGGTDHVTYSITTVDANVPAGGRLTVYAGGLLADESLFFNGYAETDGALSVYGGAGNDTFAGGPANDAFVGGAGDDTMYGLGGMDWLEGGLGADTMRGGPGNDVFVYQSAAESTAAKTDHIVDFEYVSDHIVLTNVDANSNAAGDQAFNFIGGNAFSHTAGELRAYQAGASWFVEGDVDGDGNADLVIQVDPVAGHAIIASDFLL